MPQDYYKFQGVKCSTPSCSAHYSNSTTSRVAPLNNFIGNTVWRNVHDGGVGAIWNSYSEKVIKL